MQTNSIWESISQLVQTSMAVHNSRTSNLEKGTLPYMALYEQILKISLNTSMFIPCILWQFLLPFLFRGLVFSPHKMLTAKNKIHTPKDPAFSTGPRVFHLTPRFPQPGTPHPGTPAPRFPPSRLKTVWCEIGWLAKCRLRCGFQVMKPFRLETTSV